MRPIAWALLVTILLFITAMVVTLFRLHDPARPEVAVGVTVVALVALLDPRFWIIYILGFALTYWWKR
jgi:hypothetical protein